MTPKLYKCLCIFALLWLFIQWHPLTNLFLRSFLSKWWHHVTLLSWSCLSYMRPSCIAVKSSSFGERCCWFLAVRCITVITVSWSDSRGGRGSAPHESKTHCSLCWVISMCYEQCAHAAPPASRPCWWSPRMAPRSVDGFTYVTIGDIATVNFTHDECINVWCKWRAGCSCHHLCNSGALTNYMWDWMECS